MAKDEAKIRKEIAVRKISDIDFDLRSILMALPYLDTNNPKVVNLINDLYIYITSVKRRINILSDIEIYSKKDEEDLDFSDISPDFEKESLDKFNKSLEKTIDKLSDQDRIAALTSLSELDPVDIQQIISSGISRIRINIPEDEKGK